MLVKVFTFGHFKVISGFDKFCNYHKQVGPLKINHIYILVLILIDLKIPLASLPCCASRILHYDVEDAHSQEKERDPLF